MDTDITSERYEIKLKVEESDIDLLGHVNNTVYLRWVQDAAVAHWTVRANGEDQENIFWVVTRHEIDYKVSAKSGDEIIAVTWVGGSGDLLFERHTEIFRAADRKLLAKARTLWCPMNSKTGKIHRSDPELRKRFSTGPL